MKRARTGNPITFFFAIIIGAIIGALIWLYLKGSNVGITLIWDIIPEFFAIKHYTIVMCIIGGLVIGLFHHFWGKYPDDIREAISRLRDEKSYPYRKLPLIVIGAFLPIFFGGSVGPEAGLVCILIALCCWGVDILRVGKFITQELVAGNPYIGGGYMLKRLLREIFRLPDSEENIKKVPTWERWEQVVCGICSGLTGLIIYLLFNVIFGRVFTLPRLESGEIYLKERFMIILLIAVGIGAGYLYLIFHKVTSIFFDKMREKRLHILNSILGGLVLGIIGTIQPMVMFSGGSDFQTLQYQEFAAIPYMLVIIGVVKLFLTNFCIESGWRGGHFFPVLFAGLSIGYGIAIMMGINEIVSVVVVSCALLATMFQQPLGALFLGVIFFPLDDLGWMIIASLVAGVIPVPAPLRMNPENKGFIYSIIHRKESQFKLPSFK
ncbi:MAG: chloride channel protein [Clostridiales bacterium]|nr:chloride channel protein [Clostridiales bacterium]